MTTTTGTLYYLCRSENVSNGVFGSADQCAYWYLTYGEAEYRIYPKLKNRYNRNNELAADDVHLDEGDGLVWYVAFKSANDYLFREARFTVVGNDEKEAYRSLCRHVVEHKLLDAVDRDDDFYMVPAEQALPSIIRRTEMRELYDLAGEPASGMEGDVVKWFCNADHSKEALLKMVDILSSRPQSPLTAMDAAQIKKQIAYSVVDDGLLSHYETPRQPSPLSC